MTQQATISNDVEAESVPVVVARPPLLPSELDRLNRRFETASSAEIVAWTVDHFQRVVVTTSFSDLMLIDIATSVVPDVEVVFVDTGFHFPETLDTMSQAQARYGLNLTVLGPAGGAPDQAKDGIDACCAARKVAPLDAFLNDNVDAWMSGLRRDDSPLRATAPILSIDRRGLVKVNPMANLTEAEARAYARERNLAINPLTERGYASIGCAPCTVAAEDRSGRWVGSDRTECGLHQ